MKSSHLHSHVLSIITEVIQLYWKLDYDVRKYTFQEGKKSAPWVYIEESFCWKY